jgi:hypothetical protein
MEIAATGTILRISQLLLCATPNASMPFQFGAAYSAGCSPTLFLMAASIASFFHM